MVEEDSVILEADIIASAEPKEEAMKLLYR